MKFQKQKHLKIWMKKFNNIKSIALDTTCLKSILLNRFAESFRFEKYNCKNNERSQFLQLHGLHSLKRKDPNQSNE